MKTLKGGGKTARDSAFTTVATIVPSIDAV
jgi:hypothetical protein